MAEPRFSEQQIQSIVRRMRDDYRVHFARLRVRRLLIDMVTESFAPGNGTGTNVPPPFDKSKLIIQSPVGDVVQSLQQYKSMVAANAPKVQIAPVVVDRSEATERMKRMAAEEERLRATLWDNAGGREKQGSVAWSQAWGRVGWYFTLPRDRAFGMPDRAYYDLPAEEIEALKAAGKVTPEPVERADGSYSYPESGSAYMERRKAEARRKAVSSRSLFTLDAFPPDVVLPAFDSDGVKWAAAQVEVPSYDFGPGSAYAKAHHDRTMSEADVSRYGLYYDRDKKRIVGGVTSGGEPAVHDVRTWTYTIFATREEVYCLVSDAPDSIGTLIWYAEHDMGDCPFVPVPAIRTDSSRPGAQFSSPMEKLFAEAPILNQLMTLASLIVSYNGIPRWVIVKEDGSLIQDAKTGEPMVIASESAPGLDPKDAEVVGGKPMQLTIDAEPIFKWLQFYAERFDSGKPSPAVVGAEGVSGSTAWGMRQMIEQQLSNLKEPVENHAGAVAQIQRMWGRCLRKAAERDEIETVYAFALPQRGRKSGSVQRGLVEFDPAEMTDAITVTQSSDTAQSRIVKQQAGIERLSSGTTTLQRVLEEFMEEDDPQRAEVEIIAYDLRRFALYGDTTKIQPQSILYDFALALRGRISQRLMELSPAYAIATAETMAQGAMERAQSALVPAPGAGSNMASATGISEPGLSAPITPPGAPGGGQVSGIAPAPTAGVSA